MSYIEVIGACQNNLKSIDIKIPKNKITIFTGRSGSGKTSLVFNTIAAESNRLLGETYSSYLQGHLIKYDKPKVDEIRNLPVAMIIDQKRFGGNSRSTVGTISDVYAAVRLLWSRLGSPFVGYSSVFSFNNPYGMCESCQGLGYIELIDIEQLVDFNKSLNEGAIRFPSFQPEGWRGKRYLYSGLFDNDKKIKDYSSEEMELFLNARPQKLKFPPDNWPKTAQYEGLIHRFKRSFLLNDNYDKKRFDKSIKRVTTVEVCTECKGERLNSEILRCKINGLNISEFTKLTIDDSIEFLKHVKGKQAEYIIEPLLNNLKAFSHVGLGYLSLNRSTLSLSGGESQRIKLIRHLGSSLSDLVYIIDEPSVGLHPEDIEKINDIIKQIRDKGNTVLVVEHDPGVIRIADHIIDMGPGSGEKGGKITFEGSYESLLQSKTSTGNALNKKMKFRSSNTQFKDFIHINNVSMNNIKNASTRIPINALTVVTGPAGSGKSTLISKGLENEKKKIYIDQKPINASNRSNILTYLGIFDYIRELYSSKTKLKKGMFSYNSEGACPECKGKGFVKMELAFMADYTQICEMCNGKRYCKKVLDAKVNGYSIADLLDLTVEESISLFYNDDSITKTLKKVEDVGLNYIKLGQPLSTLSGGESQRLKLSKYLELNNRGYIYIFDEPTTGLHEDDIPALIKCFNELLKNSNTVVLIEHNLNIMTHADWIIDIGPGAGDKGGKVLYSGIAIGVMEIKDSLTSKHLRRLIE